MKTDELFRVKASKINESMLKAFGKKLNLEAFDVLKLEDARNKLRTQIHNARSTAGFNENLENDALHQAQFMLDAINAELAEREEAAIDSLEITDNEPESGENMEKVTEGEIQQASAIVTAKQWLTELVDSLKNYQAWKTKLYCNWVIPSVMRLVKQKQNSLLKQVLQQSNKHWKI